MKFSQNISNGYTFLCIYYASNAQESDACIIYFQYGAIKKCIYLI